ncbi:benzoate-CoA ligase family protein [Myxococcaceae bacterium GXIMD 01537]
MAGPSPPPAEPMRASDLPQHYNAIDILERNLPARAGKTALYSPQRNLTFREVSEEVNQVGHALRALGIRPGEHVALLAFDGPEWVTCFFGAVKVGAVAVGLNTLLKPHDHERLLRDCEARVLVIQRELLPGLMPLRERLPFVEQVVVIGAEAPEGCVTYSDWTRGRPVELEAAVTRREDICSLNYSSGTTGEPKGIPHAHKDYPLTAQLWGVNVLGLREGDRTFALSKLFFTFGTGGNLIFPWYVGASCVLFPGAPRVVADVLGMIARFKPTIFFNAPTGYAAALAAKDFGAFDLSSLRLCVSASEALPAPLWHAWKERTGLDIIDGLGCTENFHIFLSNRPGDVRPGSSGRPVPGYEVKLLDDDGRPVARGELGNLLVKGETAALAYRNREEQSRHTFRGDWLFTGDKYTVDGEGYYWHAGRSDDLLKVGGLWVSPVEVEGTLAAHPAVRECAVVGHADLSGLIKPRAFVVLRDGFEPSKAQDEQLIAHCLEHLEAYKRPRWVEFVAELPRTSTGKVQRYRLREAPP